jgi:PPM family protein phosphatase
MVTITAAALSDPGCKREHNEDRLWMNVDSGLFVLADGMGGERCGEVAAELAIRAVKEYLAQTERSDSGVWPFGFDFDLDPAENFVINAVRLANREVWEACQTRPECEGMGSTISVLLLHEGVAAIGNIGDSRVYLCRDGTLQQLTRDDALVVALVEAGQITAEQAKTHPLRNLLTLSLGNAKDVTVRSLRVRLQAGDRLLLCTDGLHGPVNDIEIKKTIESPDEPQLVTTKLVEMAKRRGGEDNISCIVVNCADPLLTIKDSDVAALH